MVVGTLKKGRGAAPPAMLSPFKGGLNNIGEGATIADDQLAVLRNFDIDTDGTLVNRPPIENTGILPPIGSINVPNLAKNPRLGTNDDGWGTSGDIGTGTFNRSTNDSAPYPYKNFARLIWGTGHQSAAGGGGAGLRYSADVNFEAGETYTFAMQGQVGREGGNLMSARLIWYNSSDTEVGSRSYASTRQTNPSWLQRFVITAVAPAGATRATFTFYAGTGATDWDPGDIIFATAVTITKASSDIGYFDGDTPSTKEQRYEWAGTPNASASNHWDIAATPNAMLPLGYYIRNDGRAFVVATGGGRTWIYDTVDTSWTQIWEYQAADFAQYDNKIVVISETRAGGYWENGNFTVTTSMPLGSGIVVYNERFWAFGPKGSPSSTTVYFSNITAISPATSIFAWTTATDFFVVDKGDGQYITAIVADPNALLIFRNASTYQFTYPNAPANGSLTLLNSSVGADHRFAVTRYENYYWVLNQGYLYQFISYQFYPRNSQIIRFSPSTNSQRYIDVAVSVLGERIIVFYYGNIYVYSVRQQTWAEWTASTVPGRILQMPSESSGPGPRQALAWMGVNTGYSGRRVLLIADNPAGSGRYNGEAMSCTMRTKTYDFNLAGTFKRLLYWAIGFRSASGVTGQVVPVGVNGNAVTLDDMQGYTFDDFDLATWDAPIFKIPVFSDNIDFPATVPVQVVAKARAQIRFLSAYFEVTLNTRGTAATAPARVFSLTAYLKQHADTGEKVS